MRRRFKRHPKTQLAGLLLLVTVVAILLPGPLTDGLSSLLQVLVPLQHGFTAVGGEEGAALKFTAEEVQHLQRRLEGYENRFAALGVRIAELEQRNQELAGIRDQGLTGGKLIPARIVAADSLPWREGRLLERGTLAGIGRRDPVVSNYYISLGQAQGVGDGLSILSAEALVGEIVRANTHTSWVLLMSDPAAQPRLVRIARRTGDHYRAVPAEFMIYGLGGSRMEVRGVSRNYVENGDVAVGDVVLTSSADERLPVPLMVGHVTEMRRDDDNGVLYNLVVASAVDLDHLKRVYVVKRGP